MERLHFDVFSEDDEVSSKLSEESYDNIEESLSKEKSSTVSPAHPMNQTMHQLKLQSIRRNEARHLRQVL